MSDISCERSVLLNDHLAPGTLYDVYAYPGPAGRIANDYIYGGDDNEHVPPEDRGKSPTPPVGAMSRYSAMF